MSRWPDPFDDRPPTLASTIREWAFGVFYWLVTAYWILASLFMLYRWVAS